MTLASWWTGSGAAFGGALIATGGSVYTVGTGISELGNLFEFAGGQSDAVTAANMVSIPLLGISNPIGKIAIDQLKDYLADDSGYGDPCKD